MIIFNCDFCEGCQAGKIRTWLRNNLCGSCSLTAGDIVFVVIFSMKMKIYQPRQEFDIGIEDEIYCDKCLSSDVQIKKVVDLGLDHYENIEY